MQLRPGAFEQAVFGRGRAEAAGEEHVGISTDLDGMTDVPVGFEDCAAFQALVEALLDRGLPARAVRLVLGENFLRKLEDAERVAR